MKLNGLLSDINYTLLKGDLEVNIKNIVNDSRKAEEGSLFICIEGFETDGHKYIDHAIEKGAKAILVEKDIEIASDITVVKIENMRETMALLACRYYNYPSKRFRLVGVTGTNGKTSTVFLIKHILETYKKKTGIIGTIENRIGDRVIEASRTTPDSIELQELFLNMAEENVNSVIMEVSSHALDLHRVDGSEFDIGVFTNLSLDHLEYHKTMEKYRDAKAKLFKMSKLGIINLDDEAGRIILAQGDCKEYLTYGCNHPDADLNAYNIHNRITGTDFTVDIDGTEHIFEIQTPGKFSVYNALAAIAVAFSLGVPLDTIKIALKENSTVKGRFQTFKSKRGYYAIVDYAHTPDGLLNVLDTVKECAQGRIITVFGCGGNRDRSKRPKMGEIAGEKSDYVIITSDNPRKEEPSFIMAEIEEGIRTTGCSYEMIVDRAEGIKRGLSIAMEKDIVLIAGKGHENYQILGAIKIHFDDAENVVQFMKNE